MFLNAGFGYKKEFMHSSIGAEYVEIGVCRKGGILMGLMDGKVCVVTGSARGIGKACLEKFLDEGAMGAAVSDMDTAAMEETRKEFADKYGEEKVIAVKCDVTNRQECQELMDETAKKWGQIDVLVNNAGITRDQMFHKMSQEAWDFVIDVNLKGSFNCSQAAMPYMRETAKKEREEGKDIQHRKIIHIPSIAGLMGNNGQANYTAAKMGLVGLMRTMCRELGQFRVNINCVAPGFIETRLTQEKQAGEDLGIPKPIRDGILSGIPFGRFGDPSDIANCVFFFASPMSDYVTGQMVCCSGGLWLY